MRRWWRALAVAAVAFVVFVALGFFAVPPLLRPMLEERLTEALSRSVTIGRVELNPLALSATLRDVTIGERGPGPDFIKLEELYANAEAMSLFRWAPVVDQLRLTRPVVHLVRGTDNRYNVSDLIDRVLAAPPGPTPRFSVSNIQVVDGRIDFDDRPEGQKHEVTAIAIGVPFLSSLPVDTEVTVAPTLAARVNGQPLEITGETRPFKDTHETQLHWQATGLPLPRYLEYLPGELPVKVTGGTLDAKLDLTYRGRGRDPPELVLAGNARVTGVSVQERSGAPLLTVPSASVAVESIDPVEGRAQVGAVTIEGAELDVRRAADGTLNLTAFTGSPGGRGGSAAAAPAKADQAAATAAAPFRFHVARIALTHGKVRVVDEAVAPKYATTLDDVTLDVADLTGDADRKAAVALAFTSDAGERVTHKGSLGLDPVAADGRLEIAGLNLRRLFPYYAGALNREVDDGVLDLATDVRYASSGLVLANLGGTVRELRTRLPDEKQPLWRVARLSVGGGTIDIAKHSIVFDTIDAEGAVLNVRREPDGRFNLDRLLKTPAGGVKEGGTGEAWRVEARKASLVVSATYVDQTVMPPVTVALTKVVARGENLTNGAKTRGRIDVRGSVDKRGTFTLAGPLSTAPLGGTLDVAAKDIDVVPLQPYIAQGMRIVASGGAVSLKGTLDFAAGPDAKVAFKGDALLADIVTVDEASKSDLVKWKSLALNRIDARVAPLSVAVDEIAADGLYARLVLGEDGVLNLQQLGRDSPSSAAPAPPAPEAPRAAPPRSRPAPARTVELPASPTAGIPWLKLGKASVTASNLDFTDHFIRPNYSANLTDVSGRLSTLAFDQAADVELRGSVQGTAPVEITGKINPLARDLFLDLDASAREIDLPPLTPYSARYVGYGIEKGKLSMKVHYLVEGRKLTAQNSVILDQLTFGPKVESPEATKLPVLLAVSLLKDRNGVINFDLPVGGSLDDPQFSVAGLVFRAIGNLIGRMVTAPFALLASLGGGKGGDELAYVEFAPGSAALDTAGEAKVDSLAKALGDRPALKLDVAGRIDPASDREALKHAALERKVRAQKFDELAKGRDAPASIDAVQVPPAEYDALLLRIYKADDAAKSRDPAAGKDPTREEMEAALLAKATVSEEDLRQLADRRAQAVRERLARGAHVPSDRVYVVAPKLDAEGIKDKGKATRVDFALR